MSLHARCLGLLLALLIFLSAVPQSAVPVSAQPSPQDTQQYRLFLPIVFGPPLPPNPFGFDVRTYTSDAAIPFASATRPKWARTGDVFWSDVEPVRGGGYHWEVLAENEQNIRRLREAGIEPVLIVQRTPSWAQSIPGRICSPMKRENISDFANFLNALAARYADGPLAVHYWEIWNEPDFAPDQVGDDYGSGCWVNSSQPYNGGFYYGEVLKQIYPAIKSASSKAFVLAGALAYGYYDPDTPNFLTGILASGAGNSFDALSFHAYGEWDYGDLLVGKAVALRWIMETYGLKNKPLFATEIGATCSHPTDWRQCPSDFLQRQANYAARIYAETMALDLMGALWFTLMVPSSVPLHNSQLIDDENGNLVPRQAYYAFRNSSQLLAGARYIGQPLKMPTADQMEKVQTLTFRKSQSSLDPAKSSTLYVMWVPRIDMPKGSYNLPVKPGTTAICVQGLQQQTPSRFYCSDVNQDGEIPLAIGSFPQYVEVIDP